MIDSLKGKLAILVMASLPMGAALADATAVPGAYVDPTPLSTRGGASTPIAVSDYQGIFDNKETIDGLNIVLWPSLWHKDEDSGQWLNVGNITDGVANELPAYIYEYSKYGFFGERKNNFTFKNPSATLIHGCTIVSGACPDLEGDRFKNDGWEELPASQGDVYDWAATPPVYEITVNGVVEKKLYVETDMSKPFRMNIKETTYVWRNTR